MTTTTVHRPARLFWAVALGHMGVDLFGGMAPVLLVFLSAHSLRLTNTEIGAAIGAFQLCGSLSQPVFGLLGDRSGGRWISAGGVAWMITLLVVSMAVAQVTHSYALMLIPFVLSAFGSAAFHPVGAMHASQADAARAATNTSMFFLMGTVGSAIGPAVAGFLLDRTLVYDGLFVRLLGPAFSGTFLQSGTTLPVVLIMALVCLPVPLWMALSIPNRHVHVARRAAEHAATLADAPANARLPLRTLTLFGLILMMRSVVSPGAVAFVPALFESKGWDATEYGFITSVVWLGGGIAGVVLGNLSDRFESRYLIAITLILSAPFVFVLSSLNTAVAFVVALMMGALSGGPHSLLVLLAQGLLPKRRGLASGTILGFMFASGAIATLVVGRVADFIGIDAVFRAIAVLTAITGVLSFWLPSDHRVRARAIEAAQQPEAVGGTLN